MPPVRFYLWHQHSGDLLPNRAVGGMLKAKHTARSADQGMVAIHEIESSAGLRVEVCGMLLNRHMCSSGTSAQHFKAERMKKKVCWRRNAFCVFS